MKQKYHCRAHINATKTTIEFEMYYTVVTILVNLWGETRHFGGENSPQAICRKKHWAMSQAGAADSDLLPRDAMLVRYMLSSCVCPSVTSWSPTKMTKPRITQAIR